MKILSAASLLVLFCATAQGQLIREDIEKKTLALAEECAANLLGLQTDLPTRWAVLQRRTSTNTGAIADLKINVSEVEEVWAHDSLRKITYSRGLFNSKGMSDVNATEAFPMGVFFHESPQQIVEKLDQNDWIVVRKKSNIGYNCTFPLAWSVGLLNSARSGSMGSDQYLSGLFLGTRSCLYAKQLNNNLVTGVWGSTTATFPFYALKVTFDIDRQVPTEYALVQFQGSITLDAVREGKFKEVEKGSVEWKEFRLDPKVVGKVKKDKEKILLPVKVRVLSVMNKGEEMECENELLWKFGKDVPDSVFVDPTKSPPQEPEFEEN